MKREQHNQFDVIEFCKARHLNADIVGHWIWVKFDNKPSAELRQALKDFGFRWSNRRGEWSHDCGHPSKRSKSMFDIIFSHLKYSSDIAMPTNLTEC